MTNAMYELRIELSDNTFRCESNVSRDMLLIIQRFFEVSKYLPGICSCPTVNTVVFSIETTT